METDREPLWPYWSNLRSWWAIRDLPNIEIEEAKFDAMLHCSFAYMKAHASDTVPLGGAFWDAGAAVFIHQGKQRTSSPCPKGGRGASPRPPQR